MRHPVKFGLFLLSFTLFGNASTTELWLNFPPPFQKENLVKDTDPFRWLGASQQYMSDGQGNNIQVRYSKQIRLSTKQLEKYLNFIGDKLQTMGWMKINRSQMNTNGVRWLQWRGLSGSDRYGIVLMRTVKKGALFIVFQGSSSMAAALDELAKSTMLSAQSQNITKIKKDELKSLLKKAQAGDRKAMFELAQFYRRRGREPKDLRMAVQWIRKSANAGYLQAMYFYGVMLYRGDGVHTNNAKALAWFKKAAYQGHKKAIYNVGILYAKTRPPNYRKALTWISLAMDVAEDGWYAQARHAWLLAKSRLDAAQIGRAEQDKNALKLRIFPH